MKQWLCTNCGRRGETEADIIMKICAACQEEMEIQGSPVEDKLVTKEGRKENGKND